MIASQVELSRFDTHHAHLFAALLPLEEYSRSKPVQGPYLHLGLLFHTMEYPALHECQFPVNLGYCQTNSTCEFSEEGMAWRNIIWINNTAVALNVGPASSNMLGEQLVMDGLQETCTVLESDFGTCLADVYYFKIEGRRPQDCVFLIPR